MPSRLDPHSDFTDQRVCFSPVLVYLFALLALLAQMLLMFFCTWILFNNLKRKSSHRTGTTRLNSRSSSQLTSDVQSIYSLRTGNSTLKNYYTSNSSSLVDSLPDCIGLDGGGMSGHTAVTSRTNNVSANEDDLNKLWTKDHQWPVKLTGSSKFYRSNAASIFDDKHTADYFGCGGIPKERCLS